MGYGGELATLFVRLRPSSAGFQAEATAQLKRAVAGVTEEVNASAKANIAATEQELKANQLLIASYKEIGAAAAAGSEEAIIASKKAADLQVRNNELVGASSEAAAVKTSRLRGHVLGLGSALGLAFGADIAVKFVKNIAGAAAGVQKSAEVIRSEFGPAGESVTQFGEKGAHALNITTAAADTASARFGILYKNLHIAQPEAAKMTIGFEQLVGSMAKIRGVDPGPLLQNIVLAAAGNTRGLKQLGIVVDTTTIKYKALQDGLISNLNQAITPSIKAQEIYRIATANLPQYLDQAAKHSGDLANVQRNLSVQWETAKETLGADLLPVFSKYVGELANWLAKMNNSGRLQADFRTAIHDTGTAFSVLKTALTPVIDTFKVFSDAVGGTKHALEILVATFVGVKLVAGITATTKAMQGLAVAEGEAGAAGGAARLGTALGKAGLVAQVGLASFAITSLILKMTGLDKTAQHAGAAVARFIFGGTGATATDTPTGLNSTAVQKRLASLFPEASKLPAFARDAFIKARVGNRFTFNDAKVFYDNLFDSGDINRAANVKAEQVAGAAKAAMAKVADGPAIKGIKAGKPLSNEALQTMLFGGTFNPAKIEALLKNLLNYGDITAAQFAASQAKIVSKVKDQYDALTKVNQQGITTAQDQLAQMTQSLQTAIKKQQTDVTSAVENAKKNLDSIGQSIAQTIGQAIDKPITDAQAKLQTANDKLNLENLRKSIILPGGRTLSADPKKALAELLALQRHVGQAGATAVQDLINKYQGASLAVQQDAANKRKQDITKSFGDLTSAFGHHEITAKQFNSRLRALLKADLPGYKKIGDLLGTAVADGLRDQVHGLFAQAQALVGFTGRARTSGSEVKIIKPLDILHADQRRVEHIQTQIRDKHGALLVRIAKANEKSAAAQQKEDAILAQIRASSKATQANTGAQRDRAVKYSGTHN